MSDRTEEDPPARPHSTEQSDHDESPGRWSWVAIASLALGIVSFPGVFVFFLFGFAAPSAIVLAVVASVSIVRSKGKLRGALIAGAGFVLGVCGGIFSGMIPLP